MSKKFQPIISDTDGNIRNRLKILVAKTGRKKSSLVTQALDMGLKKIEIKLAAEEEKNK